METAIDSPPPFRHPALNFHPEGGPTLVSLADWAVARYQHDLFDGWPRGTHYIHEAHKGRLNRVRPMLPGRLHALTRYKLWELLTMDVNKARDARTAAFQAQADRFDDGEEP